MKAPAIVADRIDLRRIDLIVAAVLALDLVLETVLAGDVHGRGQLVTAVLAVPFAATIAVRRRWPAGAVLACAGIALGQQLAHGELFTTLPSESAELAPILCAYGAGAWLDTRRGAAATAGAAAMLLGVALVGSYGQHVSDAGGWSGGLATVALFLVGPWVIGMVVRSRGQRAAAFAALEAQAAAERSERERAAVAQERMAIGRELQDIIIHSVSVMVIQAAGARRLVAQAPDPARDAILVVEQTGREVLAEMRRLLGMLRKDDDPRALVPQPGLDQLPELVAAHAARGLSVQLREDGDSIDLSPGTSLVAYRVVEAVLEAAGRHRSGVVTAIVRYQPQFIVIEVSGGCRAADVDAALGDVATRVELYDGRLERMDAGDHGFGVRCSLPLERAIAA